jgi:hypothetical protein
MLQKKECFGSLFIAEPVLDLALALELQIRRGRRSTIDNPIPAPSPRQVVGRHHGFARACAVNPQSGCGELQEMLYDHVTWLRPFTRSFAATIGGR